MRSIVLFIGLMCVVATAVCAHAPITSTPPSPEMVRKDSPTPPPSPPAETERQEKSVVDVHETPEPGDGLPPGATDPVYLAPPPPEPVGPPPRVLVTALPRYVAKALHLKGTVRVFGEPRLRTDADGKRGWYFLADLPNDERRMLVIDATTGKLLINQQGWQN